MTPEEVIAVALVGKVAFTVSVPESSYGRLGYSLGQARRGESGGDPPERSINVPINELTATVISAEAIHALDRAGFAIVPKDGV